MALGNPAKLQHKTVTVTVLSGAATGSSAADPDLVAPAFILGWSVTGLATNTGVSKIDSMTLNADGSVTVTTNANVTAANMVLAVQVGKLVNAG